MLKNQKKKKKQHNQYLLVSSQTIQMGIIIFLGAFLGKYLDEKTNNTQPVLTIIGSLTAIFIALYFFFKKNINGKN